MAVIHGATYAQMAYQVNNTYHKKETDTTKFPVDTKPSDDVKKTEDEKKIEVKGANTYGSPKLSEKALEYYNSLKAKFGNLNFVLVASDKKQEAEMMKGSFASAGALTVLIDTEKIERMATDEQYRKKYEAIIANAQPKLASFKEQLGSKASGISAFGMTFNKKGEASFFAVVDKSLQAQRDRIERKAEEKKEAKKKEQKKAEKEKAEARLEKRAQKNAEKEDEKVMITADSVEELLRKLDEYYQQGMFESIRTTQEQQVGTKIDFSI